MTPPEVDGVSVRVTYRRTSRLSVRIGKQGNVSVSAPYGMPRVEVERFLHAHTDWIRSALHRQAGQMMRRQRFFAQLPLSTPTERRTAVLRLQSKVAPLMERYAAEMDVVYRGVDFKPYISCWGKCNVQTRVLTFSLYLLLVPEDCLESVVVHELAHLIEANHSARFYAVMDRHYPRWREARIALRRIYCETAGGEGKERM